VLALDAREERPLSELARVMSRTPACARFASSKPRFETLPRSSRARQIDAESRVARRILLRYSGTWPVARVMLERRRSRRDRDDGGRACALIQRAMGKEADMTERRLVVNVDHVATLRQARLGVEPDPVTAATLAMISGADGSSCTCARTDATSRTRLRVLRQIIHGGCASGWPARRRC
jgi:hypothetical protein